MHKPNQTCSAGYFCRRNAKSSHPNQGEDANVCPEGHYCLNGTGEPYKCPIGTLSNQTSMIYVKISTLTLQLSDVVLLVN